MHGRRDKRNNLLGNLGVHWAVLEVTLSRGEDSESFLSGLRKEVNREGYMVDEIFESRENPGLYHVHIKPRRGNQNA